MFSPRTGLPDDKTKLSVIAVGIEIIAKKKYKTAINVPLGCFLINATTNTVTFDNTKIYNNSIYTNYTNAEAKGVGISAMLNGVVSLTNNSSVNDNFFNGNIAATGKYNQVYIHSNGVDISKLYLDDARISGNAKEVGIGGGGEVYLSGKLDVVSAIETTSSNTIIYQNGNFDANSKLL